LKLAVAVIWTVLLVVPASIVEVEGTTVIELSVGFTKNPRQLTARANVTRAAKAPAKRSFDFVDDICFDRSRFAGL